MPKNNSSTNSKTDNSRHLRKLKLLRAGYPAIHEQFGMVTFVTLHDDETSFVIYKNEKCVAENCHLRPLDHSDWEDKETAKKYRELILNAQFVKSYRLLHPLRSTMECSAVELIEFLIDWQQTHGGAEWFYCTVSNMVRNTYLSKSTVLRGLHTLVELGIVGVRKEPGKGNKNFYSIVWMKVSNAIDSAIKEWKKIH